MATLEAALTFAGHGDWRRVVPAAREALAGNPEDPMLHALLALGLSHLEQGAEAVAAGRRAVALAPEMSFAHYAHGWALLEHSEIAAAERAAREALRLDPGADEHSLLAQVHIRQRRWQDALDVAERGLSVEPENAACANLRAIALSGLGRTAEAVSGVHEALSADPDDAYAHANRGWLMLREAKPQEAQESFSAALRLDPTMDWARVGMIEAMKARNSAYRLMLGYSLWSASLSNRGQWLLIFGLAFGFRFIRGLVKEKPELSILVWPLVGAYVLFIFGTWIADPLSNLFLRLHPAGRLALNRSETIASNVVGGCVATALLGVVMIGLTGSLFWVSLTAVSAMMLIPIGGAIKALGTRAWQPLKFAAFGFTALGMAAVASSLASTNLMAVMLLVFVVGVFVYGWVANYLILKYR